MADDRTGDRHGRTVPLGQDCPTCGFVHTRCRAHAKHSNPERHAAAAERWGTDGPWPCMKPPRRGSGLELCDFHGPAPQIRAKGAERAAEAAAEEVLRRRLGDRAAAQPITDPTRALARLAGDLHAWYDESAAMVAEMGHLATDDGTDMHPIVKLHERAQDRLAKLLVDMERIGIAQHHLDIEEADMVVLQTMLAAVLAERGVDPAGVLADLGRRMRAAAVSGPAAIDATVSEPP